MAAAVCSPLTGFVPGIAIPVSEPCTACTQELGLLSDGSNPLLLEPLDVVGGLPGALARVVEVLNGVTAAVVEGLPAAMTEGDPVGKIVGGKLEPLNEAGGRVDFGFDDDGFSDGAAVLWW